jgi:hypothetical protein
MIPRKLIRKILKEESHSIKNSRPRRTFDCFIHLNAEIKIRHDIRQIPNHKTAVSRSQYILNLGLLRLARPE